MNSFEVFPIDNILVLSSSLDLSEAWLPFEEPVKPTQESPTYSFNLHHSELEMYNCNDTSGITEDRESCTANSTSENEPNVPEPPKFGKKIKKAPRVPKASQTTLSGRPKGPAKVSAQKQYTGALTNGFGNTLKEILKGEPNTEIVVDFLDRVLIGRDGHNKNRYKVNSPKAVCSLFEPSEGDDIFTRDMKAYLSDWFKEFLFGNLWIKWMKEHFKASFISKLWMVRNWEEIVKNITILDYKPKFVKVPEEGNPKALFDQWIQAQNC